MAQVTVNAKGLPPGEIFSIVGTNSSIEVMNVPCRYYGLRAAATGGAGFRIEVYDSEDTTTASRDLVDVIEASAVTNEQAGSIGEQHANGRKCLKGIYVKKVSGTVTSFVVWVKGFNNAK